MPIAIFKTSGETLPAVLKHAKYALAAQPNLARGDLILLAQTLKSLRRGEKQIRHCMTFVRSYLDRDHESYRIWARHWRYMIEGANVQRLSRPFNIGDVQRSGKNYGQGGTVVYLDPVDEEMLRRNGYFTPA